MASLLRSFVTVSGLTFVSRVLGLVRDLLTAALLGAGPIADAFFVAFRLPNLFRRLFAEGAFGNAFVPLFARRLEQDGRTAALQFAGEAMALLVAALIALTIVAELAMPAIVLILAPGFADDPRKLDLAIEFSRIAFPYLLFTALMALLASVLNAFYRFAAAAAAPILLNVVMIAALLLFADALETPGHALAWGVAVAGVAQVLVLAVDCRRAGIRIAVTAPRLTPAVRRLLRLMAPGALGAGVMQINLLVGTMIASLLPTGAVAYLYYADRIYQLPLGVVGIALATAVLPQLARELRSGREDMAHRTLNRGIEIALLLTLPAAAALLVIPGPIIAVLFERGAFGAEDSAATAAALAAYAAGLPAFVLAKVLSPAFFAREDTRTPVVISAATVAMNLALALALVWPLQHVGLALATSLAAWFNAGWLAIGLARRGFLRLDERLRGRVTRALAASVAMGALLAACAWGAGDLLDGGAASRFAVLLLLCAGGAAFYLALAHATGAMPLGELRSLLLRRRPASP